MKPQDLHKGEPGAKKKSAGKKRKHEDETHVEGSKKKKKVPSEPVQNVSREDFAAEFSEDLVALRADQKLPNSRLQQLYDSITTKLLRLGGETSAQLVAADVTRAVVTSQDGRQLFQILSPTSTAGQAQAALRLLTASVTSGSSAARVVLAEFKFNHGRLPQVAAVKNLSADTDNRVAFVTFVMSFLIGHDRLLIQALLEKVTPLTMVAGGLSSDRSATIQLVLSTWKHALLENPRISKKDKIRIFNARHMVPLLELYRWRGHRHTWKSRTNKYKKKRKLDSAAAEEEDPDTNPADPEELNRVRQSAHQFCTLLFTSHQHGVLFKDASLGTAGTNCNPVLLELVKAVTSPWRDQLTADLIVATLAACPDLQQHYVPSLLGLLAPRPSAEWRAVVAMATAAVARTELKLPAGEARLAPEAVCRAASACFYPPAYRQVFGAGVEHEDSSVRRASLELLATAMEQVRSLQSQLFLSADYGAASRAAVAADVTPHLPPCVTLMQLWEKLTAPDVERDVEQMALVLRAVAACHLVAPGWSGDGSCVAQLQTQLQELQQQEQELQQLPEILQPLTAGIQLLSSGPDRNKLRPSDVPAILASLIGEAPPTPAAADLSGTEAPPTTDTSDQSDGENSLTEKEESDQTENMPTLDGKSSREILTSYISMATPLIKATPPPVQKILSLNKQLTEQLASVEADSSLAEKPAPGWPEYVKQSLKRGLRQPDLGTILLPSLTQLMQRGLIPCRGAAGGSAAADVDGDTSCELLYEMALSHSAFLERVLDPGEEALQLREAIFELLLATATRCRHVCKSSHVAVFLAAYGATLSRTDQLILQLISRYEMAGVSLHTYQPMVWGSAALSFYNPTQGGGLNLRSQPSCDDVIALLDVEKMALTCQRLPLKVALKLSFLPADSTVYDPRFLLSALCQLTAPEQQCDPLRLISAGALSLLICLLSCRQAGVRAAAWTVIARLYQQLEASRRKRLKQIWLTLLDLLRTSLPPDRRLPFVVAHTWARLLTIVQDPGHRLFHRASRYLLKQAAAGEMTLDRVPLFFELFNSALALDYRWEHAWMVDHLCQSVRQMSDYGILQRTVTFKLVMGLAGSCLASARPQLLKMLETTVHLPFALLDLDYRCGLLTWLTCQTSYLTTEPATRAALVSLTTQISETLQEYLTAQGRGAKVEVLMNNLVTFVEKLRASVTEDSVLRPRVEQCWKEVTGMASSV